MIFKKKTERNEKVSEREREKENGESTRRIYEERVKERKDRKRTD